MLHIEAIGQAGILLRQLLESGEQLSDGFGILNPLFLGFETFVRGYAWESFETYECAAGATLENSCPSLNRLYGNRLAVASFEMRIPFIGVEQ